MSFPFFRISAFAFGFRIRISVLEEARRLKSAENYPVVTTVTRFVAPYIVEGGVSHRRPPTRNPDHRGTQFMSNEQNQQLTKYAAKLNHLQANIQSDSAFLTHQGKVVLKLPIQAGTILCQAKDLVGVSAINAGQANESWFGNQGGLEEFATRLSGYGHHKANRKERGRPRPVQPVPVRIPTYSRPS